jgi:uncharacterized membrane protein YphA (DoxX/SURF4 family)
VLVHLRPFLDRARDGLIYRDSFYEPYAAWYPELPRGLYVAMLWTGVIAALAMAVGLSTRVATVVTFATVAYNLFLSKTHMHNNRALLVIVLAILAVAPCGREVSADAWLRRRRGHPRLDPYAPAWPLLLLRFEVSVVYAASGFSKLVDSDWFGGNVTWDRMVRSRDNLEATPLPTWVIDAMTDRDFHTFAAKVIVLTELVVAFGLWSRHTRYAAVWLAVVFHVSIEISASVQVFSYLALAALAIWAVPSTRDRVIVAAPENRRVVVLVRALDWLARFRIDPAPRGTPLTVIDRDGTRYERGAALALVLSRLPLTAWFALPALLRARSTPGRVERGVDLGEIGVGQ